MGDQVWQSLSSGHVLSLMYDNVHICSRMYACSLCCNCHQATEIGKQVNNLRKHSCKEVRFLAKGLVR